MSGQADFQGAVHDSTRGGKYWLVMNAEGIATCSCGRSIEKVDDETWRCSVGFPQYRPAKGEVKLDKFGNLMFKVKPHEKETKGEI